MATSLTKAAHAAFDAISGRGDAAAHASRGRAAGEALVAAIRGGEYDGVAQLCERLGQYTGGDERIAAGYEAAEAALRRAGCWDECD